MTTQPDRLSNAHVTAHYVCSACHGALVEKRRLGADVVVCAAGCWPAGWAKRSDLAQAEHARLTLLDDAGVLPVAPAGPELAAGRQALYGNDDQ